MDSGYYVSVSHWGVFKITQEQFYSMIPYGIIVNDNFLMLRK